MAKAAKLDAARDAIAADMGALARAARLASPTPEQSDELDRLMEETTIGRSMMTENEQQWDALKLFVKAGLVVFAVWALGVIMLWW